MLLKKNNKFGSTNKHFTDNVAVIVLALRRNVTCFEQNYGKHSIYFLVTRLNSLYFLRQTNPDFISL